MRIILLILFILLGFWYCSHIKPSRMPIAEIDANGFIVDNFSFINPSAILEWREIP